MVALVFWQRTIFIQGKKFGNSIQLLKQDGKEISIALYVDDINPTIFYKQIGLVASKSLNNGGKLFLEINEKYSKDIITILGKIGFVNIQLKKDINDKDRMIKAIWK